MFRMIRRIMLAIVFIAAASTAWQTTAQSAIGTRDNPIPRGDSHVVGDWELRVIDFDPTYKGVRERPSPGHVFTLVRFEATYVGNDVGDFGWSYIVNAVGASNVAYDSNRDCGSIPDGEFSIPEVFPGGTIEVNYCWEVEESDLDSLLVYFRVFLGERERVFFAIHENEEPLTPSKSDADAAGTPGASPIAEGPGAGAVSLEIDAIDVGYSTNELAGPAGAEFTITITNTGVAQHSFVIDELDVRTVLLYPGESETVTINAPAGEYTFYCSVPGHRQAGMEGVLILR